ncbi:MAG: glycosyltransferase [Chloroflexi bacterium]|nr:MAG: glycosyltransferase [Chloroflexota bacterium]
MKIYNTLTKRIEEIVPIEDGKIKMYSCGPTVYRFIHIGNLRTFTMADWIRRTFEYRGFQVLHVKNITDVGHMRQEMLDRGEDKLVSQARKEGKTSLQIAQFYTEAFHADEAKLDILPAQIFPRATEHVPEMIAIIQGLLAKGIAYEVGGYVYYDIKRFPGWHIECSAMSIKYLGEHFDVHTGGVDNIFPHHEDEIAQSEGFTGQQFVNYWVHAQHLLADGQKMAKSTGNAYTCEEIEARGFDPMALRYFYTTALYRSRLNFTFRALQAAQTALERLRGLAYRLFTQSDRERVFSAEPLAEHCWRDAFLAEVENDLNMPRAMSVVWEMLRSKELEPVDRVRLLLDWDRILGFDLKGYLLSERPQKKADPESYLTSVPSSVAMEVRERGKLRAHRDYAQADQVRQELGSAGYALRDTTRGTLVLPRRPEDEFTVISSSADVADATQLPDLYEFSVNLLAHNSCEDLKRCIESICQHAYDRHVELVIIDNGSTDDTLEYLQQLARGGDLVGAYGQRIALHVLFADHNMGFAAGRNATMRASRGRFIILMDTSIEVTGDIWEPLEKTFADPSIGVAGPYGLVTDDLREFREATGPDVDAIEGYLMAFRRELLPEVGWIDEKFRFYRLMDIYFSFFFKTAGYRAVTTQIVTERIEKHPHREWYSLSEEERATKSKKNYDIFRARWHHGESLLVVNFNPEHWWRGHDHAHHVAGEYAHTAEELPSPGVMHAHEHRHWPDHSHSHAHYHEASR